MHSRINIKHNFAINPGSHFHSHPSSTARCIIFQIPILRPRRKFAIVDIGKDIARSRPKQKGLSQNLFNIEAIENVLREKDDDILDIVMIDEHIDMIIAQGLNSPELRAIIQVENQRAAQMAANLKSCTLAINGVQMALSTTAPDSNKEFKEALLTYLRAAITQFLANITRITPRVFLPKPKFNRKIVSQKQNKLSTIGARTHEKTITIENS
ncbi:putative eka-like protein [Golovinomyces cichoracearum]|uniref:Putative eka-like protein n=1 Tax=Golovinomyces cichoracearum TaxID=62708 RepID=A0A420HBQ1_9PEZI|nr:putative eka-like protein [Golovinomyces cichoracearum]